MWPKVEGGLAAYLPNFLDHATLHNGVVQQPLCRGEDGLVACEECLLDVQPAVCEVERQEDLLPSPLVVKRLEGDNCNVISKRNTSWDV